MTPYESVLLHLAAKFPARITEASRNGTLTGTFPGTTKPFLRRAVRLAEHVMQRRAASGPKGTSTQPALAPARGRRWKAPSS